MEQTVKLKSINWSLIYTTIILVIVILLFTLVFLRTIKTNDEVGQIIGYTFWIILPLYLYSWFKAKHFILLPAIGFFSAIIFLNFGPQSAKDIFAVMSLLFSISILYILVSEHKQTLRHRKLLEIAAKPIDEIADGFTQRPFPVGNVPHQKSDLNNFANFLKKHKIAIPFIETNNAILCFPENWYNRQFQTSGSYLNDTRVTFNSNGDVTSVINKIDYSKYKDQLTFDQLCASFGNLFITFFNDYQKGHGYKILDKIKK